MQKSVLVISATAWIRDLGSPRLGRYAVTGIFNFAPKQGFINDLYEHSGYFFRCFFFYNPLAFPVISDVLLNSDFQINPPAYVRAYQNPPISYRGERAYRRYGREGYALPE